MKDSSSAGADKLVSGRLLGRNVIWNLGGSLAPLLAAALTVPYIINTLGMERFGLLTLIWALIGYFSFFDLGLGQAITRRVAEGIERESELQLAEAIWTAAFLMLILSIFAGLLIGWSTPWMVEEFLNIPTHLQDEFITSLWLVAISMPIVVTTTGLRGVLEAYQEFRVINLIRIPMGVFIFISPLFVLPFEVNLIPLVVLLIIGRLAAWSVYFYLVIKKIPSLRTFLGVKVVEIKALISFGSWMTISNLIIPIMVYFDRFVIGSVLTLAAVAYYVTSHEVVTRLRIIPTALSGVIFPAFSRSCKQGERSRIPKLFAESQKAIFLATFPVVLFITLFASEGLSFWLDAEFSSQAGVVVKWLAAGVFVNALGAVPVNLIRAVGRPDITAKIYLLELPFFFLLLIQLVERYGINGAAFAYFFRWLIDTVVMLYFSIKLVPKVKADCIQTGILLSFALLALLAVTFVTGLLFKLVVLVFVCFGLLIIFRQTFFQWKSFLK